MTIILHRSLDSSSSPRLAEVWPESVPIRPGQAVLIKPNLVLHEHPRGGDVRCLIAQGDVVRQVLDAVGLAMGGNGRIIIGDSPLQTTDFAKALDVSGIGQAVSDFERDSGMKVDIIDFRQVHADRDERGHIRAWKDVPGDPAGTVTFDLDGDSMLCGIEQDSDKFRVSNYQAADTMQYHGRNTHRYVIARSVLDADVIISLPKMKTHCKVGVTLAMKNFVGTVSRKQCLAHHRDGGAPRGGDEYPDRGRLKAISVALENAIDGNPRPALLKLAYRVNERLIRTLGLNPIRDGGWYGNDTCWRMTLDLVRIAMYGRTDGTMADEPQRRILSVVDGLIAGENEGPLEATPVDARTIVFGGNPLLTDIFTATYMGFDYRNIPLLREALSSHRWPIWAGQPLEIVRAKVNRAEMTLQELAASDERMRFQPPMGWRGRMELP